jgi:hypothetical protein
MANKANSRPFQLIDSDPYAPLVQQLLGFD